MPVWYEDEEGEKQDTSTYAPKQAADVPSGAVLSGTDASEKQRADIAKSSMEGERNQIARIPDPVAPAAKAAPVTPALQQWDKVGGEKNLAKVEAAVDQEKSATDAAAKAQADANTGMADQIQENSNAVNLANAELYANVARRNAGIEEQLKQIQEKEKSLATKQVSEGHFWKNPFNIIAALAQSLTPLGSGRIDGRANINAMIQRDLDEQKHEYENAKNSIEQSRTTVGQYRQLAGDAEAGDKLLLARKYEEAGEKLVSLAKRSGNPMLLAQAQKEKAEYDKQVGLLRMGVSEKIYRHPQIDKPGVGLANQAGETAIIGKPLTGSSAADAADKRSAIQKVAEDVRASYRKNFGKDPSPDALKALVDSATKDLPPPPKANNLADTQSEAKAMERPDVVSGAGSAVVSGLPVRDFGEIDEPTVRDMGEIDEPVPDASADPDVKSAGEVLTDTLETPLSRAAKAIGARVPGQVKSASSAAGAAKTISVPPVVVSDNAPGTRPVVKFQRGGGTVEGTDQTADDRNADVANQLRAEARTKGQTLEQLNKDVANLHIEQAIAKASGKKWKQGDPFPQMTPAQTKAARDYAAELEAKGREETAKITSELTQAKVLDAEEDHRVLRMMQAKLLKRYGSMEAVDKKMGVARLILPKALSPGGRPTWEAEKKMRDAWQAQFGGPDTEEGKRAKAEMDQVYDYMMYVRKAAAKYKIQRTGAAANEKEMVEINTDFSPEQSFRDQISAVGQLDASRQNVYNHIVGGYSSSAQALLNSRFQNKATAPVDRPNQIVQGSK